MPKTRSDKELLVQNFADKLARSKSVVFTDFKGLTMKALSDLRKNLKSQSAQFVITKNSLLGLAVKQNNLPEIPQINSGPTATLFSYEDEVLPIKTLVKAFKDAQIGQIKAGLLNGAFLDSFSITRLAALPGKQELRAQVVGTINAPIQGMVTVLSANLRNLVYALNQIKLQKGGE